jgi:hypothetical protein
MKRENLKNPGFRIRNPDMDSNLSLRSLRLCGSKNYPIASLATLFRNYFYFSLPPSL